jgi:hypothetical protein
VMWPQGVERCGQRLTGELRKPITAHAAVTQLATRSGTSAGTHLRFSRWRSRAAAGFILMPPTQRTSSRHCAPKKYRDDITAPEPNDRCSLGQLRRATRRRIPIQI